MWGELLSILLRNNVNHNLSESIPKRGLWGVSPTGSLHLGYLPYIGFLTQLKKFGTNLILLIADYHAYMDSEKTRWRELSEKTHYYYNFFEAFGFKKETVVLSNVYTRKFYVDNFYRFSRNLPTEDLIKYAGTTLKCYFTKDYRFSDFLYVATQVYDVFYFDADLILSGLDESGIYKLGLPIVDKIRGKETFYTYFPLIPGIYKEEMHASDDKSNIIVVHEEIDIIKEKIRSYLHHCLDMKIKPTLIYMIEDFILPLFNMKPDNDIIDILKRCQAEDVPYIAEKLSEDLDKILKPVRKYLECSI